jgi:hypothetical protein
MLTGCGYRGLTLERIGRSELWTVNGEGSYTWNEALAFVDTIATMPAVETLTCVSCGHRELLNWMNDKKQRLLERQLCFACDHWQDVFDDPSALFAPGAFWGDLKLHAYTIGDEDQANGFRGFGGNRFVLQFADGRKVVTTNLWHLGELPERMVSLVLGTVPKSRLASFVNE